MTLHKKNKSSKVAPIPHAVELPDSELEKSLYSYYGNTEEQHAKIEIGDFALDL